MIVSNRLEQELKIIPSGISGDQSAAVDGTTVDKNDLTNGPYEVGILAVEVEGYTSTPTVASVTVVIEDSADGSTWAAVTDLAKVGAASVTFALADIGQKTLAFRPGGLRRYFRARLSAISFTGGSSPKAKVRSAFILGEPRSAS